MRFTSNERANRPRRRYGTGAAALLAALAATEPAFTTPAFAQDGRVLGSEAYANAVDQATFLRALGRHPVLDEAHPRMTPEIAAASVASLGNRIDSDNGAALVETLSYIGAEGRGGAFAQELAGARIDRTTGDAQWTDITAAVEGFREGQQLERGARIEVRRVAVDSRRVIPGMTARRGDQVVFDQRDFRVGGRGNGESTTAIEIRIVDADGSSQLIGYMDDCGNITPWAEAAPIAAAAAEDIPCIDVVLDASAITNAGGRVLRGTTGVLRVSRRDGANLSGAEVETLRTCNARTVELSGNPLQPCPDCEETHGNASDLASLVVFTPTTGLRDRARINPSEYTAHLISRYNIDPMADGRLVFSVPEPTPDGNRVYYHPAWCVDVELNGRQYRLELQGEQDLNVLREAGDDEHGSMTVNVGNRSSVWQEIGSGGRLSETRYNFRGGRMVEDRNWRGGVRQ